MLAGRERRGVAGPGSGPGENFKCREFFFGEPSPPQGKMKPEASCCIHYNKIWVEWTSIALMVFGVTVPAFVGNGGTTAQSLSGSEKLLWMVMAMAGGLCIIAQTAVNFVIKEDIEYGLRKFVDSLDSEDEDRKQQALCTEVLSMDYIDSLKMLSNVESALFGIAPSLLGAMAWVYVDEDSHVALLAGSLFKMPVVLSGSICGIGFFGNMALAAGPFGMKNTTVMLLLGNVVTAVIVQGAMAGLLELYNSFEWASTLIVAAAVAFYFSPVWYRSADGNAHSIQDKSQAVDHLRGTGGVNGPSVVINLMALQDREKASL
jgi:hypothetical protein